MPECNSAGLAMLEPRPLGEAVQALERGAADTVIVLENDLFRRAPAEAVTAFLERARHVVVLDHLQNRTTERAELLIPAAAFAEADGTLVNSEGRAQRFFQVFVPEGDIQESWRWLAQPAWSNLDDVIGALAAAIPALAPVVAAAPPADFRMARARVPRQPHRYSGRTAMLANITLHEPKPPDDPDTPLAFSMEGNPLQPPPPLVPFFWAPQWNSIQAVNKFQDEIAGPLRGGDSGVRLFEPGGVEPSFPAPVPPPFRRREGEWLVLPSYRLFGSDELSMAAPAIASVAPPPQVALHPDDAALLQAGEGQEVLLLGLTLPLRLEPRLARGTATAPADLLPLPAWARISRT
jgi:NADH-quinone oxidoreductase subunit G